MGSWNKRNWICPFYRSDSRDEIKCECGHRLKFPDAGSTKLYEDRYCASYHYEHCVIAM